MNNVQSAAYHLQKAIESLGQAKGYLNKAKEQVFAMQVHNNCAELQEVLDILRDPECTPAIAEAVEEGKGDANPT